MEDRELLLNYLADRDVACPECYYNLRGNTDSICPECGGLLGLRDTIVRIVRKPARPPMKPGDRMHRFAVTGLSVPAVYFGIALVMYLGEAREQMESTKQQYSAYPSDSMLAVVVVAFVAHLVAALVLNNLKPVYQRRTRKFQRAVMLLAWYWLPMLVVFVVALLV